MRPAICTRSCPKPCNGCHCQPPCRAPHVVVESLSEAASLWGEDSYTVWALEQIAKPISIEVPLDRFPDFRPAMVRAADTAA